MRCMVECHFPWSVNYFVVRCGPTYPGYLLITLNTCATRYGSFKFGLPSNRLQTPTQLPHSPHTYIHACTHTQPAPLSSTVDHTTLPTPTSSTPSPHTLHQSPAVTKKVSASRRKPPPFDQTSSDSSDSESEESPVSVTRGKLA